MTARPQVRIDPDSGELWARVEPSDRFSWARAGFEAWTTDAEVTGYTPAVVLTEDDAEELLAAMSDEWPPNNVDSAREVIRRLITAREATS